MNRTAEEQIREWYKEWCKQTKRSGGILVGGSMIELLTAYDEAAQSETEQLRARVAELEKEAAALLRQQGQDVEGDDLYESIYMKVVELVEKDNIQCEAYSETAKKLQSQYIIIKKPAPTT